MHINPSLYTYADINGYIAEVVYKKHCFYNTTERTWEQTLKMLLVSIFFWNRTRGIDDLQGDVPLIYHFLQGWTRTDEQNMLARGVSSW